MSANRKEEDEGLRAVVIPSSNYERELALQAWSEAGFVIVGGERAPEIQAARSKEIEWDQVLQGESIAGAHPLRTALTHKAQMHVAIQPGVEKEEVKAPETHVIDTSELGCNPSEAIEATSTTAFTQGWVLKESASNRSEGVHFFDSTDPEELDRAKSVVEASPSQPWVLQERLDNLPLIRGGRKFHVRVHALVLGDTAVYFHERAMACLLASEPLSFAGRTALATNRSAQAESVGDNCVSLLEACKEMCEASCCASELERQLLASMERQVAAVLQLASESKLGFFPIVNAFELYGLDFLITPGKEAVFLEANADPLMAVFGDRLKALCASLLRDVAGLVRCSLVMSEGKPRVSLGSAEAPAEKGGFRLISRLHRRSDPAKALGTVSTLLSLPHGSLRARIFTHSRVRTKVKKTKRKKKVFPELLSMDCRIGTGVSTIRECVAEASVATSSESRSRGRTGPGSNG